MSVTTIQQRETPTTLNFECEGFEKKGIPTEALDLIKTVLKKNLQLLAGDSMMRLYTAMKHDYDAIFPAIENLPSILKRGYTMEKNGQSRRLSPKESLAKLLCEFNSLKTYPRPSTLSSQESHAFQQVSHLLTLAYCNQNGLDSATFLTIPVDPDGNSDKSIVCALEDNKWVTHPCKVDANDPEYHLFDLSPNRGLLLDKTNHPLERPCILISFGTNVLDEACHKLFLDSFNKGQTLPNATEFSLIFAFTFYTGLPNKYPEANAPDITGALKSNKEYYVSDCSIDNATLSAQAKEFASAYIDWKKDEVIEKFKIGVTKYVNYSLFLPNSPYEFKLLERQLLEELAKNPEEHVETIQWLVDNSNLPLPSTDPSSEENEEILVTAKKGIELLLEAHPMPQNDSTTLGIDARLMQEDKERKQELEKAAEAPSASKAPHSKKSNRHKKHHGKTKVKPKENVPAEKNAKQSIVLSSEERNKMQKIMNGHSMKGDDFVPFALTLLKRKAELKRKGEKLNERQVGSHINVARQTLIRIHRNGRKDLQGMVSHQKSFLHEVLAPSDN